VNVYSSAMISLLCRINSIHTCEGFGLCVPSIQLLNMMAVHASDQRMTKHVSSSSVQTHLCWLSPVILPEQQVVHVIEALAEVAQDELRVAALGEDVQQVSWCYKVEAWERNALCLQVVLKGREHAAQARLLTEEHSSTHPPKSKAKHRL
jgi:hypothetical protein